MQSLWLIAIHRTSTSCSLEYLLVKLYSHTIRPQSSPSCLATCLSTSLHTPFWLGRQWTSRMIINLVKLLKRSQSATLRTKTSKKYTFEGQTIRKRNQTRSNLQPGSIRTLIIRIMKLSVVLNSSSRWAKMILIKLTAQATRSQTTNGHCPSQLTTSKISKQSSSWINRQS